MLKRLLHPIARPLDDHGLGVMEEAIEKSGGQRAVVVEDLRPGLEGSIRCQDRGAALITLTDHLKERIGAELVDWQVAQFVDDEERRLGEPRHLALDASRELNSGQRIDDIDGAGKECRLSMQARGVRQGDRQMCLADTNAAEKDNIGMLLQEAQAKEVLNLGAVDLVRETPVELIKRLDPGQTSRLHPALNQRLIAASDFADDQRFQKAAMAPGCLGCLATDRGMMFGEEWQL